MSLKILIFYFFSSIFFLTNNLFASHVTVVDGDTIKLGDVKIRFSGIDAPEINQTCVASEGKDFYGRVLGECFVNGESLSRYLVREGFAFAYKKYSDKFILDEEYAKSNRLGMWSMKFQYPWDYRKSN